MNDVVKALSDKARTLEPRERAELVEDILHSLDAIDRRLDALWAEEAISRSDALKRGELEARDFDEALEKYRDE